jgi:hypothetical protein
MLWARSLSVVVLLVFFMASPSGVVAAPVGPLVLAMVAIRAVGLNSLRSHAFSFS